VDSQQLKLSSPLMPPPLPPPPSDNGQQKPASKSGVGNRPFEVTFESIYSM